jgi:hypothetical protein
MRSDKPRFRSGKSYGKKDRDGVIHRSWRMAGEARAFAKANEKSYA